MTAITLPNSGLTAGYLDGEAGWGTGMNLNLRLIDALLHPRVAYKGLTVPPTGAVSGAVYIVGASATGAWSGKADQFAIWMAGDDLTPGWAFVAPKNGWEAYVVDEAVTYVFNGSAWVVDTVTGPSTPTDNVVTALATSGNVSIDLSLGKYFTIALAGNVTGLTFANLPGAGKAISIMLAITQGASPYTFAYPSSFKWSGTALAVSATAGAKDLLGLTSFDNGATWFASLSKGYV